MRDREILYQLSILAIFLYNQQLSDPIIQATLLLAAGFEADIWSISV